MLHVFLGTFGISGIIFLLNLLFTNKNEEE